MSSSGLIYAMIVGAWAAYLVPMWLRRQDELNEARPTERFSTALRLLTGRGAADRRSAEVPAGDDTDDPATRDSAPDARDDVLPAAAPAPRSRPSSPPAASGPPPAERAARAKVLARRRRTTSLLFVALTAGAIAAAVGGLRYLWAVVLPAALLTAYVVHLRAAERRRFAAAVDQRRGAAAAQRLHERRAAAAEEPVPAEDVAEAAEVPTMVHQEPEEPSYTADRRALVEQTDHAEWVDAQREPERPRPADSGWDPVPVPLPTYVTAPVAPRATQGLDLDAGDAWSSARSSSAAPADGKPAQGAQPSRGKDAPRRGRTPLFDQYADPDRKRAANE